VLQVHKARNIVERLPKHLHASMRQAWALDDAEKAERLLRNLAQRLEVCRNVKRWRDVSTTLRWTAAAIQVAAEGFRRCDGGTQTGKRMVITRCSAAACPAGTWPLGAAQGGVAWKVMVLLLRSALRCAAAALKATR
jgi:hypothetical protein